MVYMLRSANSYTRKRIKNNPMVFFPLPSYRVVRTKQKHLARRKWIHTQHGFYDATYEIKLFDPVRWGFFAIYIGE